MIGVIASVAQHAVIREFFELFKTPWEFYQKGRAYEVLLCSGHSDGNDIGNARAVISYSSEILHSDQEEADVGATRQVGRSLLYCGRELPVYGGSVTFEAGPGWLVDRDSRKPAIQLTRRNGTVFSKVGYDLFEEVRTLITEGQPAVNARTPSLELHIAILRDLIVRSGVSLVEIPPVPEGRNFIACLTHDVDHPSLRLHKWDHTMLGFIYRGLVGCAIDVLRGRRSLRDVVQSWAAVLKLPFVYCGSAKDPWLGFDRYTELEQGHPSTFFVVPRRDDPGRRGADAAPRKRATRYGAADISNLIEKLVSAECEIGLHGIDAWCDVCRGSEELGEIRRISGKKDIGVRTHWLYADVKTPETLENAGADYDSGAGYNEAIGYRCGTTQAYKPLQASRLLELPLHVMDTALFFPCYLDLSPEQASERVAEIVDNAVRFGGCVTVNWHDRSIAPERLWGDFYVQLLGALKNKGAWFATAGDAIAWFRKRRSATFESISRGANSEDIKIRVHGDERLPNLILRIHRPGEKHQDVAFEWHDSEYTGEITLRHAVSEDCTVHEPAGASE